MNTTLDRLACGGLLVGAIFGLAGTLFASPIPRALFWTIDGAALVMATAVLAVRFLRRSDLAAAGFLVFCMGQAIVLSTAASPILPSATIYATGIACWAIGLTMISSAYVFAQWVRIVGFVSAVSFALTSLLIQSGAGLTAVSFPLPFLAYPILALTLVGWALTIWKTADHEARP